MGTFLCHLAEGTILIRLRFFRETRIIPSPSSTLFPFSQGLYLLWLREWNQTNHKLSFENVRSISDLNCCFSHPSWLGNTLLYHQSPNRIPHMDQRRSLLVCTT